MSGPSPEPFLTDPLSDASKRERRNLLASSFIGILVALTGLVPTKISSLGIEFTNINQRYFLLAITALIIYFIIGFTIVGIADIFIWRKKYQDYLEGVQSYMDHWTEEDQEKYDYFYHSLPKINWFYQHSKWVALARLIYEFVLPTALGLIGCALLISKST